MTLPAGSRFDFSLPARGTTFPDAWRELDRAVWRWVLAHGGDRALADAAAWASVAEGRGHSALPLDATDDDTLLPAGAVDTAALQASALVEVPACDERDAITRPFVLDHGYLYLLRNYRCECAVATAIRARRDAARTPHHPVDDADLRELFGGSWQDTEARQRDAVRQAPGRRLMVLTGGPGTGKTTTVRRMLLALSREHQAVHGELPRIQVAAPTGKAAQRLGQSLRSIDASAATLPPSWQEHLAALAGTSGVTVHRLLGSRGRHGGFRFHAGERLDADIVVVDEASMLDLGLLRALLEALADDAVLLLVGDADQLTSVGTGSIMMDIVKALENEQRGDLVRLDHCFRAEAELPPVHEAVRHGDAAAFDAAWAVAKTAERAVDVTVDDLAPLRQHLRKWAQRLREALHAVRIDEAVDASDDDALDARLDALRGQQLLCALREGPFGATQAAASLEHQLRTTDGNTAGHGWFPGRAVMVTHNDPASGLYNGDVGLCIPVRFEDGTVRLRVAFDPQPDTGDASEARVRLFDPATLPAHEPAFALTVHKSQGSEYDHVAVLLPPRADSPLLTRQMLYTALSRAKSKVQLWSTPESTAAALGRVLHRHGRLAERIVGTA